MCTAHTDGQDGWGGTRGGCLCKGGHVFEVIFGSVTLLWYWRTQWYKIHLCVFLTSLPLFCFFFSATIYTQVQRAPLDWFEVSWKCSDPPFCLYTCWSYCYRHPVMAKWPVGHKWFFMKLDLIQVWLQDWTGGTSLVPLEDYFKATPFWNVTCYLVF